MIKKQEFDERPEDMDGEIENQDMGYEEKKERKTVVPGEVIATGQNFLPGENTKRDGQNIIATRFGLLDIEERLTKVIPLSGTYIPRRGNVVIGKVVDITYNGWLIDIDSPYSSFLPIIECKGFVSKKDDLSLIYNYGEMVIAKVLGVKGKGVDLTTRERIPQSRRGNDNQSKLKQGSKSNWKAGQHGKPNKGIYRLQCCSRTEWSYLGTRRNH